MIFFNVFSPSKFPFFDKVIRFSKEEILEFRRPSKILSSMADYHDVLSLSLSEPMSMQKFEPEDVIYFIRLYILIPNYVTFILTSIGFANS